MCQPDTLSLGNQAEERSVSIKAPGPAFFDYLELSLVVPAEQHLSHFSSRILVREFNRLGTIPLRSDNGHRLPRQDPGTVAPMTKDSSLLMNAFLFQFLIIACNCIINIGTLLYRVILERYQGLH